MKQIVISKKYISILEDTKLIENYKIEKSKFELEGNIYCGIVRNILPNMQAAFVDIGENKNAFIHIKDILPITNNQTGTRDQDYKNEDITKLVKKNEPILVQVKKNEETKKGARVSTHISLTGRYAVLMPGIDFVTVSSKITKQKEIQRVKNIAEDFLDTLKDDEEKYSLILRTVAIEATKEDIENDIRGLIKKYHSIVSKYEKVKEDKNPVKIFENSDVIYRTLIGVLNDDEFKIYVDTKIKENKVKSILKEIKKENSKVELVKTNITDKFDLKEQLEKIEDRKIWLNCGGFITIDHTEALTAIDVNSGKYTGDKNKTKDETIFIVNKEASIEIAKQLKLRNISGIIIIDYIDMSSDIEREKILEIIKKEIKKDRSKVQIIEFTKLDLLEITRKRL